MKKTALIFISVLLTNFSVRAYDFLGGEVISKDGNLVMSCSLYDNDNQCEEFHILYKDKDQEDYSRIRTIRAMDPKEWVAFAKKASGRDLNADYRIASAYGTIMGLAYIMDREPSGLTGSAVLVAGLVLDVVKSPAVGVTYVVHKITDAFRRKRLGKLIKFLFNPEKKGKTKRTRRRYQDALLESFNEVRI